jgi:protein TonB
VAAGLEGEVKVWLRVAETGRVLEARVHQSSGHQVLDDAALNWVRNEVVRPARRSDGTLVDVVIKPVLFKLQDRA